MQNANAHIYNIFEIYKIFLIQFIFQICVTIVLQICLKNA